MLIFMQNTEFFLKNTNKNESSNIIWEEIGSAEILKNLTWCPQLIKHDIEIADEQIIIKGFVSGFFVFKS
jgi:hypothetical protein